MFGFDVFEWLSWIYVRFEGMTPIGMGTLKETKLFISINASVFCIQVVTINVELSTVKASFELWKMGEIWDTDGRLIHLFFCGLDVVIVD